MNMYSPESVLFFVGIVVELVISDLVILIFVLKTLVQVITLQCACR